MIPSRGIAAFAVLALVAAPVAARDLARGHPCRFSLAPNYAHCTDPNDAWQLTDGERARGVYAWLDRRSVGWELERGDVVAVVVDLGERCRLDSVRISTFEFAPAGVAPPALVCSVSRLPARARDPEPCGRLPRRRGAAGRDFRRRSRRAAWRSACRCRACAGGS